MKARKWLLLACVIALCQVAMVTGCSTGGTKASAQYPVIKFVDPVSEEVPSVQID
jgi:hypothetical protein